jgi:hypothetical protein
MEVLTHVEEHAASGRVGRPASIAWYDLANGMAENNISRDELASACSVTSQAVGAWLRAEIRPDPKHWLTISRMTGLTTSEILTHVNSPISTKNNK